VPGVILRVALHDRSPATAPALDRAVDAALSFLFRSRGRDGWWRDYAIVGPSDAWITAYVGAVLAELPAPAPLQAARQALRRLARRRPFMAGWGYNAWVPPDADSTAWVLRLAEALGRQPGLRIRRAYGFLARHLRDSGGLATYSVAGPIRRFTRAASSFGGWSAAHTCVTAAAASLSGFPMRRRLLEYLRSRRDADGGWTAYWWCDREYATAFAAEAFHRDGRSSGDVLVQDAIAWAAARLRPEGCIASAIEPQGSPFATALCLRVLALGPHRGAEDCMQWLIAGQRGDGSWSASARLRIPPPGLEDPGQVGSWGFDGVGDRSPGTIVRDQRAVFTTATVLAALLRARAALAAPPSAAPSP